MATPLLIQPGTLLEEKWEVIKLIGKGTFSEIYLAENIQHPENDKVAVKINSGNVDNSVLKWEIQVLSDLQVVNTVPRFFSSGLHEGREYLIMELLTGEVMSHLRNRIRNTMPTGLVPIQIAAFLARQMLSAIRNLHEHGYIHRDIKPSNFVRKHYDSTQFVMIDFGLAKQYLDKDGTIRMRKEKTDFRGTTVYASPFVHDGEDQGPRDDLFSIMHVFIDLLCGKLPWMEAAKTKDKTTAANIKRKFYHNLPDFIQWIQTQVQSMEAKQSTSTESNFPPVTQEKFLAILTMLMGMKNDERPDYDQMELLLYECVPKNLQHDVGSLNYSYQGFHWKPPSQSSSGEGRLSSKPSVPRSSPSLTATNTNTNTTQINPSDYFPANHQALLNLNLSFGGNQEDPNFFRMKNLYTRMKTIQKKEHRELASISGSELYSLALRWKNLVKELCTLPEKSITKELLHLYYEVLVEYAYFYRMDVGTNDEKWLDFVQQQEIIGTFLQIMDKYRKDHPEELQNHSVSNQEVDHSRDKSVEMELDRPLTVEDELVQQLDEDGDIRNPEVHNGEHDESMMVVDNFE